MKKVIYNYQVLIAGLALAITIFGLTLKLGVGLEQHHTIIETQTRIMNLLLEQRKCQ
jgi:hypothetical protein